MAFAIVQSKHLAVDATNVGTVALAFTSNVTAGNRILVWVSWSNGVSEHPTGCADTLLDAFTELAAALAFDSGNAQLTTLFEAKNIAGGADTVTVTFPAARTFRSITIVEVSGDDSASAADKFSGHFDSVATSTPTAGSITPTVNGELLVAFTQDTSVGSVTITAGGGATAFENSGATDGTCAEWRVQATAGATNETFTFSATRNALTSVVSIKPAAGAAAPTPKPAASLNESRAHRKGLRLAQLREHGAAWFRAYFPGVPLRNTTLVPAKSLRLSSQIGSAVIQRATVGVISVLMGGRAAGERRLQRMVASRGRFLGRVGVAMRVPTGTPAKWIVLPSLIGSAFIERATTGTVAALLSVRSHSQKWLARRLLSSGRVTARTWLPAPPPPPPSKRPPFAIFRGRSWDERRTAFRHTSEVAYDVTFLVLPVPITPRLPGAIGLVTHARAQRTSRSKRQRDRAQVSTFQLHPAVPQAPFTAARYAGVGRTHGTRGLRRTLAGHGHLFSFAWVPLPPPNPTALPSTHSMMAVGRMRWAERAHLRHETHQSFAGTQILLGPRIPPAPPPVVVDDRRRRWVGAAWR